MKQCATSVCTALVLAVASYATAAILRVPIQYPTIQSGINAAVDGDTVLVADGTYTGDGNRDVDFGGKAITVKSDNGPEYTIIDCEGSGEDHHRGFYFHSGEDSSSVVQGFTILHGVADRGGGIYCYSYSSPTIIGNKITANRAEVGGGGISCYIHCDPIIIGNTISGNEAEHEGGGIHLHNWCFPVIKNNTITGNGAWNEGGGIMCSWGSNAWIESNTITSNATNDYYGGGGISCNSSDPTIVGNIIRGNRVYYVGSSLGSGGGILTWGSSPVIKDNLIIRNTAEYDGGGISCGGSGESPVITDNTIAENVGDGGIFCWSSSPIVSNSIVWGNGGAEIRLVEGASITVTYSDIQRDDPYPGVGNINVDPLFVTGPGQYGDYYLGQVAAGQVEESPCVDAGDPSSSVPEGTTRTDHICDAWPVDMGYHYSECVVAVGDDRKDLSQTSPHYLVQNYPNPFGSSTTIAYSVEIPTRVTLTIYDIRGALVRTLVSYRVSSGQHRATWDGRDDRGRKVASGVYFCRLEADEVSETKRMVLLR